VEKVAAFRQRGLTKVQLRLTLASSAESLDCVRLLNVSFYYTRIVIGETDMKFTMYYPDS